MEPSHRAGGARILPADAGTGWILQIDGREQSHVDLAEPGSIRYEYLRRIAHVIDAAAAPTRPISVLHLGAGALTLARYVQATRPGSPQVAVEIDRALPSLVLDALPLPPGAEVEMIIGDAADALADLAPRRFDVIVLDVFSGEDSPAHLASEDFYGRCLAALAEAGLLAINVGDDPGLRFLARQVLALDDACAAASLPGPWMLTDATLLGMRREGNLILVAGPGMLRGDAEDRRDAWMAAGPHPAAVLDDEETIDLAEAITGA